MGALVTFPRCFDFHCPAEELAITSLQNRIDRVLDDDWIGSCRLRCVPSIFGCIERRQGFGFVDERLSLGVAAFGGEQGHHRQPDIGALQRFPGLMA